MFADTGQKLAGIKNNVWCPSNECFGGEGARGPQAPPAYIQGVGTSWLAGWLVGWGVLSISQKGGVGRGGREKYKLRGDRVRRGGVGWGGDN